VTVCGINVLLAMPLKGFLVVSDIRARELPATDGLDELLSCAACYEFGIAVDSGVDSLLSESYRDLRGHVDDGRCCNEGNVNVASH
jgi:hypothetical protein